MEEGKYPDIKRDLERIHKKIIRKVAEEELRISLINTLMRLEELLVGK